MNRRDGDELYNLVNDPNETTNVIAKHPEKAASMLKSITAWDKSLPPLPRPAAPSKRKAPADVAGSVSSGDLKTEAFHRERKNGYQTQDEDVGLQPQSQL